MAQTADLDLLRQRLRLVGAVDAFLSHCLDVATSWVTDRVYATPDGTPGQRHPDVTEAILLLAGRLYNRRNSPEGVAGWGDMGVVRVVSVDPDVERLLAFHIDYAKAGGIA